VGLELIVVVAPSIADDDANNVLIPPIATLATWRLDDVDFEFDASFILPDAASQLTQLAVLSAQHPDAPISIFGHADPVGNDDYNKTLSGRRAVSVYGMLTRDAKKWEQLYKNPFGGDDWSKRPLQVMLDTLGFSPGALDGKIGAKTQAAIKEFQKSQGLPATGNANPSTREKLFLAYMDKTCQDPGGQPFQVDKSRFLGGGADPDGKADFQGCSEFNPLLMFSRQENQQLSKPSQKSRRDFENAPNRRVNVFLFQPGTRIDPAAWPCPRVKEGFADCKKRFWSDADDRRQFQAQRRQYPDQRDTFACRFYDRIMRAIQEAPGPTPQGALVLSWSKREVTPDHNSQFPAASAPTDVVPDEAKVELLVESRGVPDGTAATIEIRNADSDALAADGTLQNLVVQGNRVVDSQTGAPPELVLRAPDLYDPFDKPFYYFKVHIDGPPALDGETPRDFVNQPDKVLRLFWWHLSVGDAIADSPAGGGLTTVDEMNEVAGLHSQNPHRKVGRTAFNLQRPTVSDWGSVLRNSYSYHQGSHGDVRCRVDRRQFNSSNDNFPTVCPLDPTHPGRSVVFLGQSAFGDAEVSQAANVPSVPRYLVYFDACVAGFEPSFANAVRARGTRFVLAFRKYIPDDDAREMARQFYRRWIQIHKGDPDTIPQVFFQVAPPFFNSMRPVLFGPGGGAASSEVAQAGSAIAGALATGAG